MEQNALQIKTLSDSQFLSGEQLDRIIFDLNDKIDSLSSKADTLDYIVAASSGLLCGLLDVLWIGEFNLEEGRNIASEKVDGIVKKTAKVFGCKDDDLNSCVKFLEKKFPIPSDGNTPDFGGGKQHHLRDFGHHPTVLGLLFSLLTQFTGKSFGTDTAGRFLVVDVPEKSKVFIGNSVPSKIINGTVIWFFHLVSDVAGSSSTAGYTGGTGIPGPLLSLAKELSVLPIFKNAEVGDNSLSVFLSKLFNGTLLADHDENGKIIKDSVLQIDLRGELGALIELGKQSLPVLANECIVRVFYFIRRFLTEVRTHNIKCISDLKTISWNDVKPYNTPTLSRMLTISSGVFSTVDIVEAVVTQKYWVAINYVGVCRFAIAIGSEISWGLKRRDVRKIKEIYETIQSNTYNIHDNKEYGRIQADMEAEKLGLTLEQTEILYNIEYYKTLNDIEKENALVGKDSLKELKSSWLEEWKNYMTIGFPGFIGDDSAVLHWYSFEELGAKISELNPKGTWFKLVMLEATLFEPYYTLSTEKDKKGKEVPSKKYRLLNLPLMGLKEGASDEYLEENFSSKYCKVGFIKRLRKCYGKVTKELNEVLKTAIISISVLAGIAILVIITAGAFAPQIAVALVGSKFAGLSGAALTNACLAYLGGGAIAFGGAGMAGGTIAIVGGGAILGLGAGAGAGGITAAIKLGGKKATIYQSAKLMVSVREIFLNEEKDIEYSDTVYEQYVNNVISIEKELVEMRIKADTASQEEKKKMKKEIKNTEESVEAMKIAMKSMNKFISAYKVGMGQAS